jgi:hypothetical protein
MKAGLVEPHKIGRGQYRLTDEGRGAAAQLILMEL